MTLVPPSLLDARLKRVRDRLRGLELDGLVVTSGPNATYLTDFRGSAAVVLLLLDAVRFVTDARYVSEVEARIASGAAPSGMTLTAVAQSYDETLASLLRGLGNARVGFEAAHLTVARYNWLQATLAPGTNQASTGPRSGAAADRVELVPIDGCIERERVRKDAHEVEVLRDAARRLSAVAREILPRVRSGRRERDLAAMIDARIREAGFERSAFETIVASGPNAALPHARPGERVLTRGDLVVLDFGGVSGGYCVDLSRVVSLGPPGAAERGWHAAVLEAQSAAIGAVRPGARTGDIDAAARETLARFGLAEAFGHGTGHGLGLEIHEAPRISRRATGATGRPQETPDDVIAAGMVFTIEPGVYHPGRGGIRIEDDVLVTEDGCEVLTDVSRSLVVNP